VKLTTHLHLVPRSRRRGAIIPLPRYVFVAWSLVKVYLYLYSARESVCERRYGLDDRDSIPDRDM
jgi:hypothetical protein